MAVNCRQPAVVARLAITTPQLAEILTQGPGFSYGAVGNRGFT